MTEGYLTRFLYYSELNDGIKISEIPKIVKLARIFNNREKITGILIFDGFRFVQYIEGPSDALIQLSEKISNDNRHRNFNVRLISHSNHSRIFNEWSLGYFIIEDHETLDFIKYLTGKNALERVINTIPKLDIV